ncbi:hypothetical protein Poli38472_011990 [Pythium oligandrum]|uniref:Purple acid phosphatase n=1 Tax=Pythium oligandrum TaxID=41045 RepID=A0A8K1CPI6_PYTOL|nr:hypothetical protein Poli38472_011990 [Pythium oligandrum]|eukprot:TMW66874.1 hypothetical protein Poli38472_011990 [Pythium oligandrum]
MRVTSLLLPILGAIAHVHADEVSDLMGVVRAAAPEGANDLACKYDIKKLKCVPEDSCAYEFKLGDLTPSQSCRVKKTDAVQLKPQQLHVAFAGEKAGTGLTFSWTTYSEVKDPAVWIGTSDQDLKLAEATVEVKTYYKDEKYSLYNYHATVTGLTPHTQYSYRVGSKASADQQSAVTRVTTARSSDDQEEFDIAIYGDMGVDDNAQKTFKYVLANLPGKVDFVFHLGDISYADNAGLLTPSEGVGFFYEETYNKFMDEISPVSSTLPYMVLVGNHEAECHSAVCMLSSSKKDQLGNYKAFNTRFKMPSKESGGSQNMWYSFEHGPIHFTTINTETDYPDAPNNSYTFREYGGFGDQLTWLENDLKKADANRANTPWLIVMMHRAIYTLTMCDKNGAPKGEALPVQKAFEDLFIKYKVDQVISGHVHLYSRHYPIAKNQPVMDGVSQDGKTYTNPKAPVYLISGAAGCSEGHKDYDENLKTSWNAVMNNKEYGITKVRVSRKSLSWQFISAESGKVLDDFVITKS